MPEKLSRMNNSRNIIPFGSKNILYFVYAIVIFVVIRMCKTSFDSYSKKINYASDLKYIVEYEKTYQENIKDIIETFESVHISPFMPQKNFARSEKFSELLNYEKKYSELYEAASKNEKYVLEVFGKESKIYIKSREFTEHCGGLKLKCLQTISHTLALDYASLLVQKVNDLKSENKRFLNEKSLDNAKKLHYSIEKVNLDLKSGYEIVTVNRYMGDPEHVKNLFFFLKDDVKQIELGLNSYLIKQTKGS